MLAAWYMISKPSKFVTTSSHFGTLKLKPDNNNTFIPVNRGRIRFYYQINYCCSYQGILYSTGQKGRSPAKGSKSVRLRVDAQRSLQLREKACFLREHEQT